MKTITLLLSMLVIGKSWGQEVNEKILEPEFAGDIALLRDGSNDLETLEKIQSAGRSKGGAYSKIKSMAVVPGLASRVRVHNRDKYSFIVKWTSNEIDPRSIINIFKLEKDEKKGERFVLIATAGTYSGLKSTIEFIPFKYEKYGEKSYRIWFDQNMEPGEYALTLSDSRNLFNLFTLL
ncbi:MAG: hypothetical protein K2U26_01690 [Cyclobacteriaceae bacterium]|nr:hypothetical protein [Cyclobacteriaceae bacterium]